MVTHANRGQDLETFIRYANSRYRATGEAIITKQPTEFLPIRDRRGVVVSCKVAEKSTVDFIGRVRNRPLAMEAKRTKGDSIRWAEVKDHQAAFLTDFMGNGEGISLVVVSFDLRTFYAVPWAFWEAARTAWIKNPKSKVTVTHNGTTWTTNGKASVKESELLPEWEVKMGGRIGLDYLRKYIEEEHHEISNTDRESMLPVR